jgi:transcriptional regulator with XRE-family HTH domain
MAERGRRGLSVPRLEAWRLEHALTQRELAEHADVSRGTVVRAEAGEPISLPNVRKLAKALGISVRDLLHKDPGESKARGAA